MDQRDMAARVIVTAAAATTFTLDNRAHAQVHTTPEFWMNLQAAWDLYQASRALARAV